MRSKFFIILPLITLNACNQTPERDYTSSKICLDKGYKAGTPEYGKCIREERTQRLMEENRSEFEQRRNEELYERARRGIDRPF